MLRSLRGKRTPREGAGQLPALLLELGQPPGTHSLPATNTRTPPTVADSSSAGEGVRDCPRPKYTEEPRRRSSSSVLAAFLKTQRKEEEAISHDVTGPKGPAPIAGIIPIRKPMKYLGTLLSTEQEEVFSADGIKKRLTTVRRTVRR